MLMVLSFNLLQQLVLAYEPEADPQDTGLV